MTERGPSSIEELSASKRRLFELLLKEKRSAKYGAEQGLVTGEVAITPPQAHEFEIHNPDRHIFNLTLLLEVHVPLDLPLLARIVQALVLHHDALRLCSAESRVGWRQWIAAPSEPPVARVDLSCFGDEAEQRAELERHIAASQGSFDLATGPLLLATYFELGHGRRPRLLLLAQHMGCDQYSAGILAEDFIKAYYQASSGQTPSLSPKTTSYKAWAQRLATYAQSDAALAELPYWLDRPTRRAARVPLDHPDGLNIGSASRLLVRAFDTDALSRLNPQRLKRFGAQMPHVIVSAVAQALCRWTSAPAAWISMCQHGRSHPFPDVDVTRTVGWFSFQYPLLVDDMDAGSATVRLERAKAALDGVPGQGLSYGALRYMGRPDVARLLAALPEPDLFLNIRSGTPLELPGFKPAPETVDEAASPSIVRPRCLYLNVGLAERGVEFHCLYNENLHRRSTVESFISDCIDHIVALDTGLVD